MGNCGCGSGDGNDIDSYMKSKITAKKPFCKFN